MLLNSSGTKIIILISGLVISAALIEFIPYISGSMREDEVKPMLVINSIDFHKKIISKEKKIKKSKPIKKKKTVKKKPKKIKKPQKKIVKKQKIVKPIDKKFSTKKKEIKKFVMSKEYEIPVPEPIYRVTEKPYFLREGELIYPEDMKRLGKTAIVVVDALIDRKGKVRKTTIYKSAGKSFNDAAINAIKGSLFVPGKIEGKPVAVLYRLSMKFNLL